MTLIEEDGLKGWHYGETERKSMDAEDVVKSIENDPMEGGYPAPPEPAAPKMVFVSEGDRLKAENKHLKAVVLTQQIAAIQQQVVEKVNEHKALEAELRQFRSELEAKYGINLLTHYIRPGDGAVLPRPENMEIPMTGAPPNGGG